MELGKRLVVKALVGDQNYNTTTSKDESYYCSFVLPTFEDLYERKVYKNKYHLTETGEMVYDVRQLRDWLVYPRLTGLEVLFSEDITFGPTLSAGEGAYLMNLYEYREDIARMNLPYLYKSSMQLFFEHKKNLLQVTPTNTHLIEQYGYDTHQASRCAQILDILLRYAQGGFADFKSAIWFDQDSLESKELQRIEQGAYSKDEMFDYLKHKKAFVDEHLKERYRAHGVDESLNKWLEEQIQTLVEAHLRETLMMR